MTSLRDVARLTRGTPDATALLGAYIKFLRLSPASNTGATVDFLGYRFRYLDAETARHLFREIFVERLYDVSIDSAAPRILDCGSNIGMSVLFFKHRFPGAKITAFEPHPVTFKTLRTNIETNGLDVALHQVAVAEREGTVDFFSNDDVSASLDMSILPGRTGSSIEVQARRLSDYIDGEIDLLKLDVEGAEEQVLTELGESGALRRIKAIVCEYHHHRPVRSDRLSNVLAVLEGNGFGYQLRAHCSAASHLEGIQDVLIYAYRK
ncbi:MAG: FkbM family methyltransferase [Gemmatimonadales bacterium]